MVFGFFAAVLTLRSTFGNFELVESFLFGRGKGDRGSLGVGWKGGDCGGAFGRSRLT